MCPFGIPYFPSAKHFTYDVSFGYTLFTQCNLRDRAETDPAAAAELVQQRAQQSEAVKKSRQKMYADAAARDLEAKARYERFLVTRRENYHKKKQAETEAAQAN